MNELQAARVTTRGSKGQPARTVLDCAGEKLKKQFVLPDFHDVMKGYVKPDDEPQDAKEQVSLKSLVWYGMHISSRRCGLCCCPLFCLLSVQVLYRL